MAWGGDCEGSNLARVVDVLLMAVCGRVDGATKSTRTAEQLPLGKIQVSCKGWPLVQAAGPAATMRVLHERERERERERARESARERERERERETEKEKERERGREGGRDSSQFSINNKTLNYSLQYTYGVCLPQPGSGRDAAKALKLPKILAAQFRARSCDPLAGLDTVRAHAARELSVLRSCEPIPSRHLKGPFPRSLGIFPVARSRRGPLVGALNLFLFVLP